MLSVQNHLTNWIPIAVPMTKWFQWPPPFNYPLAAFGPMGLYYLFFKFYDSLCGKLVFYIDIYYYIFASLDLVHTGMTSPPSHIMSIARAERKFPQLNIDNMKYCM